MSITTSLRIIFFGLIACQGAALPAHAVQLSATQTVADDVHGTAPNGATFTIPAGWSIATGKNRVVLTPPETDTHIVIVSPVAADANGAVAESWSAYGPKTAHPVKIVTPRPARNGWDERQIFDYEVSPNERAFVQAVALRSGTAWTVILLDGSDMTFEKRAAPINLILQSVRPKGYQRETFAGKKAHPLDAARIARMKAFVESSMKQLGVPGVSIALVDRGKVVFQGGFGVRELGKPAPVDENTLFMAASNTKGMTTLLLAELVDEKKLRWDEPVTEAYPSFKLGDADTTRQVLIKNLICACTGLPRQDLEWIFEYKNATPETSMTLLAGMQPTSKFGEVFQYSNLMAAAAGYVGAHVLYPKMELGAAYDKAMQEKIFDPLGMRSTTFSMAKAIAADHASPHGDDIDGKPQVAVMDSNYSIGFLRPAGGVWTSAADLIKYVQDELTQGKLPNGRRLVSAENLLMRRKKQVMTGEDTYYGMGLSVDNTYGTPVVHHGGSLWGYKSDFYFLPEHDIGAVLLMNSDNGVLMQRPFMRKLLEILFDGKPEAEADVAAAAKRHYDLLAKDRERLVVPPDPGEVAKLAKHYHNQALGDIDVSTKGKETVFDFGEWKSDVASRKNDDGTISFITTDPTEDGFEFVVGERGGKRVLLIRDGQHEYVFSEVAGG